MNFSASLKRHVGMLVHPNARRDAVSFEEQREFIGSRLALSLAVLLLAPAAIVIDGPPAGWHAALIGWFLLPLAGALLVSRTGRLEAAEAMTAVFWTGFAVTAVLGSGSAIGLAFVAPIPLETTGSRGDAGRTARTSLAVAGAIVVGLALWLVLGSGRPSSESRFLIGLLVGVLVYALALAAAKGARLAREQARVAARNARVRLLAQVSEDVPLVFDRSGRVLEAGPGAERTLGVAARDLLDLAFFERVQVADRPGFLGLIADAAEAGRARAGVFRLKTRRSESDGSDQPVFAWVELRAIREDTAPAGSRVLGLLRDVSSRKQDEAGLEEARALARRNEAGRDLFLANVSHELRTPLNAIIGFAEILASESLAPASAEKRREYAAIVHQSGQHLLSVVNTILDASKIEAGRFELVPEPFDLGALVRSCADMVGLRAEQAGVELLRDIPATTTEIMADQRACRQIVLNLLSNAIKFTPRRGRVTVSARVDRDVVQLVVADTGIGIGARDLTRVGDPFFQVRDGYDRDRDGTGLGLSVVRGLVGLHGGTIALESAPGQGTRVTVKVPVDCRPANARPPGVTKIETVARYPSLAPSGGAVDVPKVHKLA